MLFSMIFSFIILSKSGNESATANLGVPNPNIPEKGTPRKESPCSLFTYPNT